jgi:AhpD family alkylhydroperoxidase
MSSPPSTRRSKRKKNMNTTESALLLPLTATQAPEASKPLLEGIQKGFGFVPNLMATFANSPAVLKGYLALDAEWEKSAFTPQKRTLVLLAASLENSCGYCTAAHSKIAKAFLKVPSTTVDAIRAGVPTGDERTDALVALVRELVSRRGHATPPAIGRFLAAGYTKPQVMELLLGIALKTISNYLDHINPSPLDAAFASEK